MKITPFGSGFVVRWVRGALAPVQIEDFRAGADWAGFGPVSSGYDADNALSAYAAFPWVRACVDAISEDLAGLPRRVMVGYGDDAEVIEDHPVLDLLEEPTLAPGSLNGEQAYQQRIMDWLLVGDAYRLIIGIDGQDPTGLTRLHPARVSIKPSTWGGVESYVYGDAQGEIAPERVLQDRLKSWANGPRTLHGTGLIRTLNDDLTTDHNAAKRASITSAQGQPMGIVSPKDGKGLGWGADTIRRMKSAFLSSMREGGLFFLGDDLTYTSLGWSPRDMEFEKVRELARHAVLADFGVPPTRVGLQSANYATAQMEARNYWQTLRAKARQLDAVDTRLARMFRHADQARVRVVTDFSNVEALQESRTDRVSRVTQLKMSGVPLALALREEGFNDLAGLIPVEVVAAPVAEVARATGTDGARLFVVSGSTKGAAIYTREDDEEKRRAAQWVEYIKAQHSPAEKRLNKAIKPALAAAGQRIAKSAEALLDKADKSYTEAEIADLLDIAAELSTALQGPEVKAAVRAALETGFAKALAELGMASGWNAGVTTDILVGQMITNMLPFTVFRVREVINAGLVEGTPPAEIRAALEADFAFSPSRALTVARTETTGAVERGASQAYEEATAAGVKFKLEWLTARDPEVRESHIPMDGELANDEGDFISGDGNTTTAPGAFGIAGEDINCRCTRVARVDPDQEF